MRIFKMSNFLFKVISRSWFLLLGVILSMFFLTSTYNFYVTSENLGYINYVKSQEFALISLALSCSIAIIFGLKSKNESVDYLINNKFNYFISALIASIELGLSLCLIPLAYIMTYIFTHKNLTIPYIANGLFEFIFTFSFAIVCTAIITTVICFLCEKTIIRIILTAIMIASTSAISGILSVSNKLTMVILNVFTIHEDFDYALYNNFIGFNHDIRYILDKVILIFILFIVLLIISIKYYKKTKYLKIIKGSIVALTILTVASFSVLYSSFTLVESNEVFAYNDKIQEDILIEEYKMNLDFGYKLKNEASIKIKNNKESEINEISLLLDNIFNIDSIKVDGKELNFTHEHNKIKISLDNSLKGNNTINLMINYSGRVNYIDSIGNQYLIANSDKILLPTESLAWYPSINQDKDIKFDLNLNQRIEVQSNLNLDEKKNSLSGNSKSVFLISGNLQTVKVEGYEVSFPLEANSRYIEECLDSLKEDIKSLKLTKDDRVKINDKKRILFAPIQYVSESYVQVVDGTIIYMAQ